MYYYNEYMPDMATNMYGTIHTVDTSNEHLTESMQSTLMNPVSDAWRSFHVALNRPQRLQIMLTAEELTALDDWRFKLRMPSRAAAIRELLQRGLAAEGFALATAGRHSGTYGVIGEEPAETPPKRRQR